MDYFYHHYNECDHQSTFSPATVDHCYCPSSTFLLSLNLILLAILIYTFTMDKITVTINPKAPFISIKDDVSPLIPSTPITPTTTLHPSSGSMLTKGDTPTKSTSRSSLALLQLPIKSNQQASGKVMVESMSTSSNCFPSPSSDSLFGSHLSDEKLINLEQSTTFFSEPLISPGDSLLNSFGSSSNGRKLIKPDFSLSFFDSSISSTSVPTDEESSKVKGEDEDDDSFKDFNILIHSGHEEDFYSRESINKSHHLLKQ